VIISDAHRYLFVEQPHTACTAIRDELIELYGGQPMLTKHATYAEFLRVATPAQKRYFVFSGLRDPLDERVSMFFKYRTDQGAKYSRRIRRHRLGDRQRAAYDYAHEDGADVAGFVRRFHRLPYDNDTLIRHDRMDEVIRFEHLQDDFARTLRRLGLEQVRPVPVVNRTSGRGSYLDYYPPDIRAHAAWVFGPFMRHWGYPLPADWPGVSVPRSAAILFRLLRPMRYVYRRYVNLGRLDAPSRPGGAMSRARRSLLAPIERSFHRLRGG
jgi:hypothetical protein